MILNSTVKLRSFSTTNLKKIQYCLIAYDGTDKNALNRRLKVREEHLARAKLFAESKNVIMGGALLNSMIGSIMILDFPTFEKAVEFVESDAYVKNKVWVKWTLTPFNMGRLH
ncbi:hypothetical protein HDU92_000999 [Lobulomyces angularis]|nr:hypothetical protein HDU92_000999 [Lobulomyces angularis]